MEKKILRQINYISRSILNLRESQVSQYNLKRGQHSFLTRIVEMPGISQKELSELLKVNKGTTAKAIKKLIEAGYIYKEKSKKDLKAYELYPTKEGLDLYPKLMEKIMNSANKALKGVDIETLDILLEKVLKNIQEI